MIAPSLFTRDRALAHLAASLSSTTRQLVTPLVARTSHDGEAPKWSQRVAFQIYEVTEHSIRELSADDAGEDGDSGFAVRQY